MDSKKVYYYDWINYWYAKWSKFVKQKIIEKEIDWEIKKIEIYDEVSFYDVINFKSDTEKTNLFFSINWYYPWARTRKNSNITSINCFYFDIDLKDNKKSTKDEIKNILLNNEIDYFDFIIESRGWFHAYKMLEDWKYLIKDKEKYIADWEEKAKELEFILWIKMDDKIFDLARLSRCIFTHHKKKVNNDLYEITMLKWHEIISPLRERKEHINNVNMELVINALYKRWLHDIYIKKWKIYRNWKESDWLKINKDWNYLNDFSHDESKWWNIAVVKNAIKKQLIEETYVDELSRLEKETDNFELIRRAYIKHLGENWEKKDEINTLANMKTYALCAEEFGIITPKEIRKNIIISWKIQEIINNTKDPLTSKELKLFLSLLNYSQWTKNEISYYWIEQKVEINDFINYNWLNKNVSSIRKQLDKLWKNKLHYFWTSILNLKTKKEENKLFVIYSILPTYNNFSDKYKKKFFRKHFINKSFLNIPTNSEYFNFLFFVFRKLVCFKEIDEYSITNTNLMKKFNDTNLQRIKSNIKKMSEDLWMFNINTRWKEIIFKKK